jgi:hypothetical protein
MKRCEDQLKRCEEQMKEREGQIKGYNEQKMDGIRNEVM